MVQSAICVGEDVAAPDESLLHCCLGNSQMLDDLYVLLGHLPADKQVALSPLKRFV